LPADPPEGTDGIPALIAAATHHQGKTAETLLIHGANVDARCPATGATPLLAAVAAGDADMVRQLVRWGADLEAAGPDGLTAYQIAHRAGDEAVMKRLVDGGADDTPAPEPERVAIRYNLTLDDMLAFHQHRADTDGACQRQRRRDAAFMGLLLIAGGICHALYVQQLLPLAIWTLGAIAAALRTLYARPKVRLDDVATPADVQPVNRVLCEHELELLQDAFVDRTALVETRIALSAIDRIATTDTQVHIMLIFNEVRVIPRDEVIEGDLDDFLARLRERWQAQRGEASEQGESSL
jgi:hypothetical protein